MWKRERFAIGDVRFIFEAKVCDEPSEFGIHGGRISKPMVVEDTGSDRALYDNPVIFYNREWIIEPDGNEIYERALAHILEVCN